MSAESDDNKSQNELNNDTTHNEEKSKIKDEIASNEAQLKCFCVSDSYNCVTKTPLYYLWFKRILHNIHTYRQSLENLPYPKSVFFIISNEFCERFSYYGMRTILSLYLRDVLLFTESNSTVIYHVFTMFAYFFPLLGAIISDSFLGKFRTILYVSVIYACGNILLALSSAKPLGIPQVPFCLIALFLIALGTGGIKPCVSAFGGDQFILPQQATQLVSFFSVFYFSINAGSLVSTFLTPVLREDVHCFGEENCYPLAFAIPGVLMIISVVVFAVGMPLYKIRKPEGNVVVQVVKCIWHGASKQWKLKKSDKPKHWLDNSVEKYGHTLVEDIKVTLKVLVVFIPLPIFWALYDQQGSAWTFQANRMDGRIGSYTILPDQMQVINPILIMIFIPLFTYVVYPFFAKFNRLKNPLERMVWGGFLGAAAFAISVGVSTSLEATYPDLPGDGVCHLRIYNPYKCASNATLTIQGGKTLELDSMSNTFYSFECEGTKNYNYAFSPCTGGPKKTGSLNLTEATGYYLYFTNNKLACFEDDISKPEDGFPKIRTIVGSRSENDYNITYYDDDDEIALQIGYSNTTLFSIDPGTYKLETQNLEFNLGGVYTVLAELDKNLTSITLFEVTEHNSVHMLWLIPQYVVITVAEILFSITGLEFSYSQAPVSMKSVLTSAFLLTSAVGNLLIVIIESIKIFDKQSYDFLLYTGLMVADMILFTFIARSYKYVKKSDDVDNQKEGDISSEKALSDKPLKA